MWPEGNPDAGSGNLRSALATLRQALAPAHIVDSDQDTLWLRGPPDLWVDGDAFEDALARAHAADQTAEPPLLEQAAALYGGDYLPDDLYEDWAEKRREALRRRWRQLQFRRAELRADLGHTDQAIDTLEQLLHVDQCDEDAAEALIGLLAAQNHRAEALHVYETVAVSLKRELGVEPREGLVELRRQLVTHAAHPPTPRVEQAPVTSLTVLAAGTGTDSAKLVDESIAARRGQLLVRADLHMGVFSNATDAVAAASEIQHADSSVRVAVTTAEKSADLAAALDASAQLVELAHAGQALLSAPTAVSLITRRELPTGASLRDLGEHRVRLGQPLERVYQLAYVDLDSDFPAPIGLDQRGSTRLPVPATTLVGRERDLAAVRALLQTARLVTLTGPGGVGKTRLALQVAAELRTEFPDDVYFVPIDAIADPNLVAAAIAVQLAIRESAGRTIAEGMVEFLRRKNLLLVIDNFEQVVSAAPLLADLLAQCAHLHILVTSRAVLHLKGEQDYHVPPLELPEPGATLSLGQLREIAAVRLFAERAAAARSDFALTASSTAAVAEICRRLDGLPLAIELAAARVRLLSSGELARLERFLPLLTGGSRDAPVRHQALRNTIAWSVDLLTPQAKVVFERLAVFAGGCTLQAAETVCGFDGIDSGVILECLAELIDMSLLRRLENVGDQPPRYRMLQTIREYAFSLLSDSGDAATVLRRHAALYLQLAERAEGDLARSHLAESLMLLEAEKENLRAALQWAAGGEDLELELGLRLASSIWRFWLMHGYVTEGRAWLEEAVGRSDAIAPEVRAKALNAAGELACAVGDLPLAVVWSQQSLDAYRELGDPSGIARSLHVLAWSLASRSQTDEEYAQATAYQHECLDLERELGEPLGEARALHELGEIARYRREYDSAAELLDQARRLRITLDDSEGVGWSSHCLAWVAYEQADYVRATRWAAEAAAVWRNIDHAYGLSATHSLSARIALASGDCDAAIREVLRTLEWWPRLQHVEFLIYDLDVLAWIAAACHVDGNGPAQAATLLGAAERLQGNLPRARHRQAELEQIWQAVRKLLDEPGFDAARSIGLQMDAEQAHRYATELAARMRALSSTTPTSSVAGAAEPSTMPSGACAQSSMK